jgi:hypothetical protein
VKSPRNLKQLNAYNAEMLQHSPLMELMLCQDTLMLGVGLCTDFRHSVTVNGSHPIEFPSIYFEAKQVARIERLRAHPKAMDKTCSNFKAIEDSASKGRTVL